MKFTKIISFSFFVLISCNVSYEDSCNELWENEVLEILNNQIISNFSYSSFKDDSLDNYFKKLSNALKNYKNREDVSLFLDSVVESMCVDIINIKDVSYVDKDFLQKNAKLSLRAWKQSSWYDSCDYQLFCDYVLPYKLKNELVDNWRDTLFRFHSGLIKDNPELKNLDSLYQYHMTHTYYSLASSNHFKDYKMVEPNFTWISLINEGGCWERSRLVMYYLRAAGAPATLDFIPEWGNRKAATHAFVGLANRHRQLGRLLGNNNDPNNLVNDVNAAIDTKYNIVFNKDEIPKEYDIQYEKTIPKVYRKKWNASGNKSVEPQTHNNSFSYNNCIDVTDQYLQTSNAIVKSSVLNFNKDCHLSVFTRTGWKTVAIAKFNIMGNAEFYKMGTNIVYLPIVAESNQIQVVDNPFVLTDTGRDELVCDYNKRIDLKLLRKYPIFSNTAAHTINFKGCKIEGANDYYFKDAKLIRQINDYPFFVQQIDVSTVDSFQYIHIISPEKLIRVAELECFEDSCGVLRKISEIKYKEPSNAKYFSNLIDGDYNTYIASRWARIEFDKPRPVRLIRFCPRSDTNFIIPGNIYELFYWDNQWISAGIKKADSFEIEYNNIPSGTIYWLKCHTEGTEERIFTYQHGKQIWW
nr:hypothetical protein [uncultured Carboxylicivirga sp.]